MANNYPDGGEQPLGPIERKVLPWLAWLLTTFLAAGMVVMILVRLTEVPAPLAVLGGIVAGGVIAAWALRPWRS